MIGQLEQLGNYRIVGLLGEGAFANVYEGEHIYLLTRAAIKVRKTKVAGNDLQKFLDEARTIARLQHPNIIQVLDFGIENGTPYLVMEYAQQTLLDFCPVGQTLPTVTVVAYIDQMASALQYAHDQRLIHRDVKPANMLVFKNAEIKLSDFGIALPSQNSPYTGAQEAIGTLPYMAPEQLQGKAVLASDQYALAIVAYQWLSGSVPFHGDTTAIFQQHLHANPPSLAGKVSSTIEQVLLRALAKDPAQRFPSVMDFARALKRAYDASEQTEHVVFRPSTTPFAPGAPTEPASNGYQPAITRELTGKTQLTSTGPAMIARQIVERYNKLIRTVQQLRIDYGQAKHDAQQLFDQARQEIETIPTWRHEHDQAIAGVQQVRLDVSLAQRVLAGTKWGYLATSDRLSSSNVPQNSGYSYANQQYSPQPLQRQQNSREAKEQINVLTQNSITKDRMYFLITRNIALASLLVAILLLLLTRLAGLNVAFIVLFCVIAIAAIVFILQRKKTYYQDTTQSIEARYSDLMKASMLAEVAYSRFQLQLVLKYYNLKAGLHVADWSNVQQWQQWSPLQHLKPVIRLGTVMIDPDFPSVPALMVCPGPQHIIFKAPGTARVQMVKALQSVMLRLLITQPPDKLHFTLIDPTGMGDNLVAFMHLSDYGESLVGSRIWTKREDIDRELAALAEHMENVIQKYLLNVYRTIDEYNAEAGELAEPYRVLVVVGFPVNFSNEAALNLMKIATNGPRCGVSILMVIDTDSGYRPDFNLAAFERSARVLPDQALMIRSSDGYQGNISHNQVENLMLDTPPDFINPLLLRIGEQAQLVRQKVEIPFRRIIEQVVPESTWWSGNTRDGIRVPLGLTGAKKYQYAELGKNSTLLHMLIIGIAGSGKTNLLHVLITSLSLLYSPDELELYLVDFKKVSFAPYATYQLPHARVVAIQSEQEFGLSVLRGVAGELARRQTLFRNAHVQEITEYRTARPGERMPRILLLIDEFQELFTHTEQASEESKVLLDRLARTGRAFGIHIILASQTLTGPFNVLPSTLTQIAIRIALKCDRKDAGLILESDNPILRLLPGFRQGEAVYNAQNGAVTGNNIFQCAWLSEQELAVYLNAIRDMAQYRQYVIPPERQQIIFDGSKNADVSENKSLNRELQKPTWPSAQQPATIWLGNPIAIREPTFFQLPVQEVRSNLLIVGAQEEVASSLLTIALLSLAAQRAPRTARFYVLDFRASAATSDIALEPLRKHLIEKQGYSIEVGNRNSLSSRDKHTRNLASIITEINQAVVDRKAGKQGPEIYLLIYGLQRAIDLRPDLRPEMNLSDNSPANLTRCFSTILRDGPEAGIHTLAWCDTFSNVKRELENGMWHEFDTRVVFKMPSLEDSDALVESPAATSLEQYRALLFRGGEGTLEKFIPYDLPLSDLSFTRWFYQAINSICQKK